MNLFKGFLGRGIRATGGWVFDETFRRHVGLSAFFAPFVAKCPFAFFLFTVSMFSIFLFNPINLYILLIKDIAYLYLMTVFLRVVKSLYYKSFTYECLFNFGSFVIQKGSNEIKLHNLIREL